MPKVDLHRHLSGAIPPQDLMRAAEKQEDIKDRVEGDIRDIIQQSIVSRPYQSGNGYESFLNNKIWQNMKYFFCSRESTANLMYLAIAAAYKDNIVYAEFRLAPYWLAPYSTKLFAQYVSALKLGIETAERDFPGIVVKLIFSVGRRFVFEKVPLSQQPSYYHNLVDIADRNRDFIVGFDLSGNEDKYRNKYFRNFSQIAKDRGFKLTIHAGETGKSDAIWEAIEILGADRIGHGLAARHDPNLIAYLASSGIPLELCPTGNWLLGGVKSIADHPLKEFMQNGIRITVNTDNPTLFCNTTLSKEYCRLLAYDQISVEDIKQLQIESIKTCFANESVKRVLLSRIDENYNSL